MAIFLEVIDAAGNITRLPVENGRIDVASQPGTIYRVVDQNGGPIGAGPRVLRVDDDIVITNLPAGEVVGLTEFFSACTPNAPCTLSLQELGGNAGETVTPSSEPVAALQEGGFLMNRLAVESESLAPIESGGGIGWKPIAAGVGGLVVVAAAAGGGGGGDDGGSSGDPVIPKLTSDSVSSPTPVLQGTAEPNSRVTIAINLGGSGTEVRYAANADADGNWSVDLASDQPIAGTLPAAGLPLDSASPITLTAISPAGLPTAGEPVSVFVDTTSITGPDTDATITAALATPGVTVSGTANVGFTPTVLIEFGSVTREVAVGADGTWSTTFTSAQLPADGAQTIVVRGLDAEGNASGRAASRPVTLDRTLPTVDIDTDGATVTNDPFVVTITFSEAVTGFTAADVSVAGGTASSFAGSGASYTLTVTPTANADGNAVVSIAQGAAEDSVGNPNAAGSGTRPVDTLGPTLNITDDSAGTATGPFTFVFTFDEAVSGFAANDIVIAGGTAGTFTRVNASTYELTVTPGAAASGTVTATVADGAAVDAAGNAATGDSASQTFVNDVTDPILTISDTFAGATADGPVVFRFSFNETVTGFTAADIDITGVPAASVGALTAVGTNGRIYQLTVTPAENTDGTISVEVDDGAARDTAGNTSVTSNTGNTHTQAFDTDQLPTLAITTDAPTAVPARAPFEVTFTFSEAVTLFNAADVTVTGGTLGTITGSGAVYTATITPTDNTEGNITIAVRNNAARDLQGNLTNATAGPTVAYDREDPELTISDLAGPGDSVIFRFTFSEAVNGFTAADITVTSTEGTPVLGTLTPVGTSGAVYQMIVTPPDGETGVLTASVGVGAATDDAGNNSTADAEASAFDTSDSGIGLQSAGSVILTEADLLTESNDALSDNGQDQTPSSQPAADTASVSALSNNLLPDNQTTSTI